MKKHFYHNIIEIDSIYVALNNLGLEPEEKKELIIIAEDSIHHTVLDVVLSELEERDKKAFLALILADDHTEIWELISKKIENVEQKIKKAVNELLRVLHEDIREAHSKKK